MAPPVGSSADHEISIDVPAVLPAISAEEKGSVMLGFGLGLALYLGDLLELPIELRASKNLGQDDGWLERVHLATDTAGAVTGYSVVTQPSWDFRLSLGLGARF